MKRPVPSLRSNALGPEVRYVQVRVPVVVVVSGGDPHAVSPVVRAAAGGHVGEAPLAAVLEQPVAAVGGPVQAAALDQVGIEIAVVVHVEEGHAAPDDLGKQMPAARMPGGVGEFDPARLGHLLEPDRGVGPGRTGAADQDQAGQPPPGQAPEPQRGLHGELSSRERTASI